MRASMFAAPERQHATSTESEEKGFSLIELIIVVVIIGILVAIALPLFGFIQKTSVDGATQSTTKNASTTAVAELASGITVANLDVATKFSKGTLTIEVVSGSTASDICIGGYDSGGQNYTTQAKEFKSGPGC